jgi:hypothetical protein
MDIGGLLSSPIGIAIAVIAGLVLLFAAWKINKVAISFFSFLCLQPSLSRSCSSGKVVSDMSSVN